VSAVWCREEMMAERNLTVDHVTIWRWVQRYAPELHRRCRRDLRDMKTPPSLAPAWANFSYPQNSVSCMTCAVLGSRRVSCKLS
jgi:hypothetical protein